jgi:hypothetical protein
MCFKITFVFFGRRPGRIIRVYVIIEGKSLLKWQCFELVFTVGVMEHQVYRLKEFVAFLSLSW